ncbi:MAG: peptidoglycan-binding protein LysM [Wenzhouxiangella sp.]
MSVFNFVKDAGSKLFGRGKSEPEALKDHATELGLETGGIDIAFVDGQVKATGHAASQEDKEKILLALGNVAGVETVDEAIQVDEPAEPVFYTVKSGDTLGAIAQRHYGKASEFPKIFEANRPMLAHPDRIYPGQVLRIPA